MRAQKKLILTMATVFFALSSTGQTLEDNLPLLVALTVGKALIATQQPFIEVSSTEGVYVRGGNAFPLSDTQCKHTGTPEEQVCSGNNRPTRIRLLPDESLKIALHPLGISQVEYILHPTPVTDPLFPGQDALPEFDSVAKAIATEIQQGVDRQHEIIEEAKQRSLMFSRLSDDERFEEQEEEDVEWWWLQQEPDADDSDMAQVRFDDSILLEPDTRYCFSPDPSAEAKAYSRAASDDGSGSEGNAPSDESSDNGSDEEEADTESDVEFIPDPFPVSKEVNQYFAHLRLKKIKQEPTSDSEILIESEVEVTDEDSTNNLKSTSTTCHSLNPPTAKKQRRTGSQKKYACDQGCDRSYITSASLSAHNSAYHSGEQTCPDCQKTLPNAQALSTHKRKEHSGEQTCPDCQKTLPNAQALSDHKRKEHSGEQTCPDCQKTLPNAQALSTARRPCRTLKLTKEKSTAGSRPASGGLPEDPAERSSPVGSQKKRAQRGADLPGLPEDPAERSRALLLTKEKSTAGSRPARIARRPCRTL